MLHRGVHEPDDLPDVAHIHADPHFAEPLLNAIGTASFDVIIAMYGRIKTIAEVAAQRCGHFIAISGVPVYRGLVDPARVTPYGMKINAREDSPKVELADGDSKPSMLILEAERSVFEAGITFGVPVST